MIIEDIETKKILTEDNGKVVLVQIGKSFYVLKPYLRIENTKELRRLLDKKEYSFQLLKEEA